ncbi:MAG: hypothetical protein SFY92_09715, partial [Verrucomicrobiae bacterium]|nr:hypothetical protein [Verrucomicrobiae bacterium]
AQGKDYWRAFSPLGWPGNIGTFANDFRPLELILAQGDQKDEELALSALTHGRRGGVVPVSKTYPKTDYVYYARGKVIERVETVEVAPLKVMPSPFSDAWVRHHKWVWWLAQLAAGILVGAVVREFWARLLAVTLVFTLLETVRLWFWPAGLIMTLGVGVAAWFLHRRSGLVPGFVWTRNSAWGLLAAVPCVTLALQSLAHPAAHWDAMSMWLPRAALLAEHNTLFYHGALPADAVFPAYEGYPPAWPAWLSVFWSFFPQLGFATGALMLGMLIAALVEILLSQKVPWPLALVAANYSYLYLYEHAGYLYAQVLTAAAAFLLFHVLWRCHGTPGGLLLGSLMALLLPVTRMESVAYAGFVLALLLGLRIPWRRLVVPALCVGVMFVAWSVTWKTSGFSSQSGRAGMGLALLLQESPMMWLHRLGFLFWYQMIRMRLNVEHFFMILCLLTWLWVWGRTRGAALVRGWWLLWAALVLKGGILVLFYFPVPVMDNREMMSLYLSTGYYRMYSHFVPVLFLLLPWVMERAQPGTPGLNR